MALNYYNPNSEQTAIIIIIILISELSISLASIQIHLYFLNLPISSHLLIELLHFKCNGCFIAITLSQVECPLEEFNCTVDVLVYAVGVFKHLSVLTETVGKLGVDLCQVVVSNQSQVELLELEIEVTNLFHDELVLETEFQSLLETHVGLNKPLLPRRETENRH